MRLRLNSHHLFNLLTKKENMMRLIHWDKIL
jgi:hypothetical protein